MRTLKTFQGTHILGASCGVLCNSSAALFHNVADYLSVADVTLQAVRDEELHSYEAYEGRYTCRDVKADKVKNEAKKEKGVTDLQRQSYLAFRRFAQCTTYQLTVKHNSKQFQNSCWHF